jgi:hypothetical protein
MPPREPRLPFPVSRRGGRGVDVGGGRLRRPRPVHTTSAGSPSPVGAGVVWTWGEDAAASGG